VVSDGDELAERFAGVTARYENRKVGTERLRFRFVVEDYHEQWNRETRTAAAAEDAPDTYRTRRNFEPAATIVLAGPLTLTVGASFENMQPDIMAASDQSANALVSTLRYHWRLEDATQQELDAAYSLRAATKILGSDFVYGRHRWSARYSATRGRHTIIDAAMAGLITGRAPLFERFVLGNSSTLRGWNKFDVDPLGGDRMVHNTAEYRYRIVEVFYDTGAVWNRGDAATVRHSVGLGFRKSCFSVAVAFPLRENRVEPIFMLGMNY
jgi:hypothetical protein